MVVQKTVAAQAVVVRAAARVVAATAAAATAASRATARVTEVMAADDLTYLGAPVKVEGRTMGSLCTMYTGGAGDGSGNEAFREKLNRGAERMGAVLDAL